MKELCRSENKINSYPIIKDFIGDEETNKLIEEITDKALVEYYIQKHNLDYIHKDKIREKLKKSKKEYEHYEKENLENLIRMTAGEIVMLEELLGE